MVGVPISLSIASFFEGIIRWLYSLTPTDFVLMFWPLIVIDFPRSIVKSLVDVNVRFFESQNGELIIDEHHFPTLSMGERSIGLKVETVSDMFEQLLRVFGQSAGTILYEMGVASGKRKLASLQQRYGIGGRQALDVFLKERIAKGWGIPEMTGFDVAKARATLRVSDLFECLRFKGKTPQKKAERGSHFFRGYLEGILGEISGREVRAVEYECLSQGDAYCCFQCEPLQEEQADNRR